MRENNNKTALSDTDKWVILDRDGVINYDSPDYIRSESDWIPLPQSLEAIALLNRHGYKVVVATNQSGIARGYYDTETLDRIHHKMLYAVSAFDGNIEHIYVCPHGPMDECACRKPKPGLYEQIAKDYGIDFKRTKVPAIGDSLRDIEAAVAANCEPVLVLTGNGKATLEKLKASPGKVKNFDKIKVFVDLFQASVAIVQGDI